jgi:hypothetical protein
LRSATHHPAGLPLLCFFNHGKHRPDDRAPCSSAADFLPGKIAREKTENDKEAARYDGVFRTSFDRFAAYAKRFYEEEGPTKTANALACLSFEAATEEERPEPETKKVELLRLLSQESATEGANPPAPQEQHLTAFVCEGVNDALENQGN